MSRRPSPFPRYVHSYRDRHGTLRTDFRRGGRSVPLPPPPLSEAWWEAYRAALAGDFAARDDRTIGAERTRPGTVAALYVAYVGSAAFKNGLAESTHAVHRNILSRWRDQWGDRRLRDLQSRHVVGWLDERADTPAAAQVFLKVLRRVMRYGISIGLLATDPTDGIKAPALKTTGIYTWTDEEIAQYRRHHTPGTNARLALELLIGTAQRKSDVVRMGRQHVHGDLLHVRQAKTGWEGDIPIGPDLTAALATAPSGNLTFLTTSWGKPYTAAGFGNHFRAWCDEAGLHARCSSHGLRKAACRQLAEAGCTPHEIAAISGHITLAEVQRYTQAVDQAALARAAAKKRTRIGEPAGRFAKTGG